MPPVRPIRPPGAGVPGRRGIGARRCSSANASWQVGSFNETLAANDIIVKYTYLGDYGLFGKVYDSDAAILQMDFDNGKTNTHTWATGSSMGDGLSDASEAGVLQFQYGLGTGGREGPQL